MSPEATIKAQEALILALIKTHPEPKKVSAAFNEMCAGMEKNIRVGPPRNDQLGDDFHAEWARLLRFIPG